MRRLLLAGAAALAFAGTPQILAAQPMAPDQQSAYQGWAPDQRGSYDSWSPDLKSYYWTLTPSQQRGWWQLNDEQRTMVHGLPPEQRTAAWQSIESQLAGGQPSPPPPPGAGMPPPLPSGAAMPPPPPGGPTGMSQPPMNDSMASPDSPQAMNKSYPVCSRTVQDGCQNAGEGGAKGKSRALPYWPGKPRSER
ncbi:MAG: hypothetical protein ABW203_01755 [Novosphingobium sp.]